MSPLQSSGSISLGDLGSFFTDNSPHSLSEFYKGGSKVPSNITGGSVPTSGTISLSNFYGVDLAPTGAKVGLSDAFFDTTGNGTDASWATYTPDVSNFAGCKVRLVWYIRTISGSNFWQSDFAIDEITIDGTTQDFSVLGSSSFVSSGSTQWERTQFSYNGEALYGLLFDTQPFVSQTFNTFGQIRYNRNINNERWSFGRGGTGSSNTGPTSGSSGGDGNSNDYYMFYEGSGNGQPNDAWARSEVYTLASSNPTMSFKRSMRGAGVDTFQFFLDVIEDADGNTNSNFHLPAKGLDYKLPLVSLGPGSYSATTAPAPWTTYTPNISRYANKTVRFVWFVFVRQYQADVQLDNFTVSGLSGSSSSYTWNGGAATGWTTSTDMRGSFDIGPTATPAVATTNKRWNIRSGGTPSGGTAHSVDASGSSSGQYLYYEATGSFDSWGFLISPEFTLGSSPSVSMAMAMYAGSAETYRCYVELR